MDKQFKDYLDRGALEQAMRRHAELSDKEARSSVAFIAIVCLLLGFLVGWWGRG